MNTIAYIFGILVTGSYIYMAFISRSVKKNRYAFRILFALVCLSVGFYLDRTHFFNKPFGFITICGSAPFIYLLYYEIFKIIMKPIIGDFPYSPYRDKIGSKLIGIGYPRNRQVTKADYVFGVALFLMPFLTLAFLIVKIDK